MFEIKGGGNVAQVSDYGGLNTELSVKDRCLFEDILNELKQQNLHLSYITGVENQER